MNVTLACVEETGYHVQRMYLTHNRKFRDSLPGKNNGHESAKKKSTLHFCLGGWGQEMQHIDVFNLGPTKQLSSYSLCRTTLFVFNL